MLTRRDTQGVMSCELATYGIPLITSDIPVCHEIFDDFEHVYYLNNDLRNIDLLTLCLERVAVKRNNIKYYKFNYENTVKKEEEIIIKN